ncbi:MAG: S9 family peptidase [Halioglobus sp.]
MRRKISYNSKHHIRLGRVSAAALSPDSSWMAVAVMRLNRDGTEYVGDLWKVPLDGSDPVQLTRGQSSDVAPCFRRDGALGFLSNRKPTDLGADEGAEKRRQIWILDAEGGEPRQLSDEPLGITDFRFARRGDRLVYTAPVLPGVAHDKQRETAAERGRRGSNARRFTQQPVRHWDHWLHENEDLPSPHLVACCSDGGKRRDLTPAARRELSIEPRFDLSEDGRLVAITWSTPARDRELDTSLRVFDLVTGRDRIFGAQEYCNVEFPLFAPDGRTLAAVREFRSATSAPRPRTVLFNVKSGKGRELAEDWDRWPQLQQWCADGHGLLVTADDEGATPLFRVDTRSGKTVRLSTVKSGGHHSACLALPEGGAVGIRSTLSQPPEPFLIPAKGRAAPRRLANLSGFDSADWIDTESIRTISTDGKLIQSWLLKPRGVKRSLPVLMWIHGGPIGMSGDLWHWRWNPLPFLARGYAIVQPNPRGSTGFGQAFIQGIWGNTWGGQCYEDIMAVADAISERKDIDGGRMMAMGGSFGGYMTNWIGTQTDRFRCLVTHASIVNMSTFTGVTDHPAWWYLEMGGENPYQNPDSFDRYAPWKYLSGWKTPTLIIHGEKDYRCPVGEALMLFEGLQYHGIESELLLFPDECHFIQKPPNIVAWYDAILEFLDRHMKRGGTGKGRSY